jgi:hypothetical protein
LLRIRKRRAPPRKQTARCSELETGTARDCRA